MDIRTPAIFNPSRPPPKAAVMEIWEDIRFPGGGEEAKEGRDVKKAAKKGDFWWIWPPR